MQAHRLHVAAGVTTTGGISMLGAAVLLVSNWLGFKNMALQPLQAWKGVSYRTPVLRRTLIR